MAYPHSTHTHLSTSTYHLLSMSPSKRQGTLSCVIRPSKNTTQKKAPVVVVSETERRLLIERFVNTDLGFQSDSAPCKASQVTWYRRKNCGWSAFSCFFHPKVKTVQRNQKRYITCIVPSKNPNKALVGPSSGSKATENMEPLDLALCLSAFIHLLATTTYTSGFPLF